MGGRTSTFIFSLGLLALLSGCGQDKAEPKQHSRVFVQTVQSADFAAAVTLTGDIQARVQTDLSFRVGGKIIQRMVDVGDRVTAKQVLAKLDPKDLQTNVDSAQAQVVAEQARVKQTAAAFVRQEKLLPKGYTSRSEYDAAQAALRSSQSALAAAQAQLANAREQLGYTALIADAPGVITARQAEVGQVCKPPCRFSAWLRTASEMRCSTSMSRCWWSRRLMRRSPSACWIIPASRPRAKFAK